MGGCLKWIWGMMYALRACPPLQMWVPPSPEEAGGRVGVRLGMAFHCARTYETVHSDLCAFPRVNIAEVTDLRKGMGYLIHLRCVWFPPWAFCKPYTMSLMYAHWNMQSVYKRPHSTCKLCTVTVVCAQCREIVRSVCKVGTVCTSHARCLQSVHGIYGPPIASANCGQCHN